MKKISKAMTLVEVVVSILIITMGLIGVYSIYNRSMKLSIATENRIKAISMAREGIEVIHNIRDTNWIYFAADKTNCWDSKNYDTNCLGGTNSSAKKITSGSYIIKKESSGDKWNLELIRSNETRKYSDTNGNYRKDYRVCVDSNGFYEQGKTCDSLPIFTREIILTPKSEPGSSKITEIGIVSKVQWSDTSKQGISDVTLESTIKNWKKEN